MDSNLRIAAENGKYKKVKKLLDLGANPNNEDSYPLNYSCYEYICAHYCESSCECIKHEKFLSNYIKTTKILLSHVGNNEINNKMRQEIMIYCTQKTGIEMLKLFLHDTHRLRAVPNIHTLIGAMKNSGTYSITLLFKEANIINCLGQIFKDKISENEFYWQGHTINIRNEVYKYGIIPFLIEIMGRTKHIYDKMKMNISECCSCVAYVLINNKSDVTDHTRLKNITNILGNVSTHIIITSDNKDDFFDINKEFYLDSLVVFEKYRKPIEQVLYT